MCLSTAAGSGWPSGLGGLGYGLDLGEDGRPRCAVVVLPLTQLAELDATRRDRVLDRLRTADAVVVMTADEDPPEELCASADVLLVAGGTARDAVIVDDPASAAAYVADRIIRQPHASLALTWLLRSTWSLPIGSALAVESSVYSMLLAGGEFRSWLASRPTGREPDGVHRVGANRRDDVLRVTLERPARRNAVDAAMRDALYDALSVAVLDPAVVVELDAIGPSFCAGGDLDEFGTAIDPSAAHLVRMARNVGRLAGELGDRLLVRVHGACVGAGVELPAFAGRVIAAPDTWFHLPEVSMGLIPGAGGTVSLPRRIGRRRTAWLALSGERLDATTALQWGLIDAIE